MKRTIIMLAALAVSAAASAQIFGPGPGGAIPDGTGNGTAGATFSSLINVAGGPAIGFLEWVEVDLTHSFAGDIELELVGPNGMAVHLVARLGASGGSFGNGANYAGAYRFVDSGGGDLLAAATGQTVIPTGTYNRTTSDPTATGVVPNPNTFMVYDGINTNGNWTLNVRDWAGADTGAINSWRMSLTAVPEPGTFIAIGIGLAGLALARRRK